MKCNRMGCTSEKEATLSPSILMYAPDPYPPVPIKSSTTLVVCEDCAKEPTLEDLVTDEGWDIIVAGIVKLGKIAPDRRKTKLAWQTIAQSDKAFAEAGKSKTCLKHGQNKSINYNET